MTLTDEIREHLRRWQNAYRERAFHSQAASFLDVSQLATARLLACSRVAVVAIRSTTRRRECWPRSTWDFERGLANGSRTDRL